MKNTSVSLLALMGAMLCFSQPVWSMEDGDGEAHDTHIAGQKKEPSIEEARSNLKEAKKAYKEAKLEVARLKGKPEKQTVKKTVKQQIKEEQISREAEALLALDALEKAKLHLKELEEKKSPSYAATLEVKEKRELAEKAAQNVELHKYDILIFESNGKYFKGEVKKLKIDKKTLNHRRQIAFGGDPEIQYKLGHDLIQGGERKVFHFRSKLTKEEEKHFFHNQRIFALNKYGQTKKEKEGFFWLKTAADNGFDKALWDVAWQYFERGYAGEKSREQAFQYICKAASSGDMRACRWYEEQERYKPRDRSILQIEGRQFVLNEKELEKLSKAVAEGEDRRYLVD
jgi:TPR repeat protein